MDGKIALEEHVAVPETVGDSRPNTREALLDIHGKRLAEMDRHGVEMMILSLNGPTIQAIPNVARAIEVARIANDGLAKEVNRRPDRFAALAALPMQDPEAAARELTRCVKELGFKGALVNGFSQVNDADNVVYYDLPQYWPFWEVVEQLDVPFYLHPREVLPIGHYQGHPWFLGSPWGFGAETAMHALRLMACGLFDKHPGVQIVLGHLGEGLPYSIWRLDHQFRKTPRGVPARKPVGDYFRSNFHLTTAGNFRTPTFLSALLELGADRLMFSVDYPFEDVSDAAPWFDTLAISDTDRHKIGRLNAIKLFKLGDGRAT